MDNYHLNLHYYVIGQCRLLTNNDEANSLLSDAEIICGDLKRSLDLASATSRKYSDVKNAKSRAFKLDNKYSQLLNFFLSHVELNELIGDILDHAHDVAKEIVMAEDLPENFESIIKGPATKLKNEERLVYFANLLYELLQNIDVYLNFKQLYSGPNSIQREILFPAEYFTSGMLLLNNFVDIIRTRYKDRSPNIKITQNGLKVNLVIEADGNVEVIEETLNDYGRVLKGEISPEEFAQKEWELIKVEQALSMTRIQLQTEKRINSLLEQRYEDTIERNRQLVISVETLTDTLRSVFVGNQKLLSKTIDLVHITLTPENTRGVLRLLDDSYVTSEIIHKIEDSMDEDQIFVVLQNEFRRVEKKKPGFLKRIGESIIANTAASPVADKLIQIINSIISFL